MTFKQIGEEADRVRVIPLENVLVRLGFRRDPRDRHKWRGPESVLTVNGMRFMDWTHGIGGGGAIDLVMHVLHCDFMAAVIWLSERFPCGLPLASDTQSRTPRPQRPRRPHDATAPCPIRDEHKLPGVLRYLTQQRRLPHGLLDGHSVAGDLYADKRSNAVFLMRDPRRLVVGAELRGTTSTPWKGMARGSRKDAGYFATSTEDPEALVLCESAIDALSCRVMHPYALCISTAGVRPDPRWLADLLQQRLPVHCGFDADRAGDAAAHAMIAAYPAIRRLRPSAKDWNDALRE